MLEGKNCLTVTLSLFFSVLLSFFLSSLVYYFRVTFPPAAPTITQFPSSSKYPLKRSPAVVWRPSEYNSTQVMHRGRGGGEGGGKGGEGGEEGNYLQQTTEFKED